MNQKALGLTLLGILAAGSVLTRALPASACSCLIERPIYPEDGAAEVPANTRIWVPSVLIENAREGIDASQFDGVLTLRGADGSKVQMTGASFGMFSVLTPNALLEPGAYELAWAADESSGDFYETRTFEVVAEIDEEPPPIPNVEDTRSFYQEAHKTCDTSYGVTLSLSNTGPIVVADEYSAISTDEARSLYDDAGLVVTGADDSPSFTFGRCCSCFGADAGDTLNVRFGSYDLAGNFSGWSESKIAIVPTDSGCSITPSPLVTSSWGAFATLALGATWVSRRRFAVDRARAPRG
jgi:hypothetical protein